jgi:anaerobic C4-dicarboxylate transporter
MRRTRNISLLLILLLAGAAIGGLLGDILGGYLPILIVDKAFGFSPTSIDLGVLKLTLGFIFHLNLAGAIGLLLGYLLYSRL